MAQPLIKFFRVASLPATGTPGALYFVSGEGVLYVCTGTSSFEAYSGARDASLNGELLTIVDRSGKDVEVDLSKYVKKEQTIAGINLEDNITVEELRAALGLTAGNLKGEENVLEGIKVNGDDLTIAADKTVDILVAEGSTNGTIAVNNKDVAVHGLGSAAYTEASAYDEAGAAAAALAAAKEYADGLPHENTTYTFAEGTVNGEFVVTPSDGVAQQVKVHGLGDAAYTTVAALESTMDSKDKAIAEAAATDAQGKADKALADAKAWVADQKYVTAAIIDGLATEEYVDNAVKTESDIARAAEKALAERLDIVEGEGEGSIKKAVADAKAELIDDATEAGNTLGKLEDRIETIVANEKTYSVVKLTAAEVTALGNSNVKEAYKLIDEDKAAVGDPILIYKDSSLKSAAMGTGDNAQKLMLTYILADGSESEVPVDLSAFYAESETGAGLQLIDHVISVKRDGASEAFLTVSENGVKLSGVQTAIDTAVAAEAVIARAAEKANADAIDALEAEVEENAQVTAAALNDLNERIDAVADSIPTELGVMSVTKGTDGNFVTTNVDNTDAANPKVSVAVAYVDGTTAGNNLTTNTYVDEHIAAAINAIPAAHVTDVVGDSASYSVVEAPEAGGVHTVKNTLATITVDDNNEATVTGGLATDAFVKTYVENQLSWVMF
jgi:hypothetical protein